MDLNWREKYHDYLMYFVTYSMKREKDYHETRYLEEHVKVEQSSSVIELQCIVASHHIN